MRAVVQRVSQASVEIENKTVGKIGQGLVVLLGINTEDEKEDAAYLAKKIPALRIFEDRQQKMNLSLREINGKILAISQFTLYADTRKGRRPSFIKAALPEKAEPLYKYFIQLLKNENIPVEQGVFGAMMKVKIYNQGPVTIILDSEDRKRPRR
ncbi:D-tyrosyl-tRNA(Tyr) deacylase [candidate division KSB1 bacterium 4484_188]|nr:MAG: D-tyrosyl-tRNA(Tyr) deacylase [candidate division KSB1 bacterium 4484_188]HFE64032.1 D-tyrosyl-tRNA(Tyr) deacylase [Caldithrix sp.]